jgi:hypothetical protein
MSTDVPLAINSKPYQNVDPIELTGQSESLYDGYIDEAGSTVSRPGLQSFITLPNASPVIGSYWWESKSAVVVVTTDGKIYLITDVLGNNITLSTASIVMEGTNRPFFADNGEYVVIANGKRMVYSGGVAADAVYINDVDAPDEVSHVAFLDQYLLANQIGTGQFHFADFISAPSVWQAVDVYTAESNPDVIIGLYVLNRIINILGTQSVEFWINDGVSPFSRQEGTITSRGCMSYAATVIVNETLFFFDNRRRFVGLSGTSPNELSTPFDKTFQRLNNVTDCIIDFCTIIGRKFLVISFPTDNRTFLYDIQGDYWAEWSLRNITDGSRTWFIGSTYVYAIDWNMHLWGSRQDSNVYEMTEDAYDDVGIPIGVSKTSGYIDHGMPDKQKRSYKITFKFKTGIGIGTSGNTIPYARLRWQDVDTNGNLVWSNYRYINLQTQGHKGFIVTERNLGSYYIRKYQIECTANVKFIIVSALEKIDLNDY